MIVDTDERPSWECGRPLSDRVDDAVRSIGARFARASVVESHVSWQHAPHWIAALVRVTCTIVRYDEANREYERERDIYVVSSLYWPTGGYRIAHVEMGGDAGAERSYREFVSRAAK